MAALTSEKLLGDGRGDAAVAWATAALLDGYDTPALRELAGLDLEGFANLFEVEQTAKRALTELGVPTMGREGSLRA